MTHEISIGRFNELTHDEKSYYLWHGATFLHAFEKEGYRINLFHMNNFYIELWYHIGTNQIDDMRAFTSVHRLEPFLDYINLDLCLN